MNDAHVNQSHRNELSIRHPKDLLHGRAFVFYRESSREGSTAILLHPEEAEFSFFASEEPQHSPDPDPTIEAVSPLGCKVNIEVSVEQGDGESIRISTFDANHVALSPYLILKFSGQPQPRGEVLHDHENASRTA